MAMMGYGMGSNGEANVITVTGDANAKESSGASRKSRTKRLGAVSR